MARNSKKDCFTLAAIVLFFGTVYFIITYGSTLFELRTPPGPTRQVTIGDNGWVEKWREPLLLAYGVSGAIANETLFIPEQTTTGVRLVALNATDGRRLWEQELDAKQERLNSFDSIAADQDQVYVTDSFALNAFNSLNGWPLWTTIDFLGIPPVKYYRRKRLGASKFRYFDLLTGAPFTTLTHKVDWQNPRRNPRLF